MAVLRTTRHSTPHRGIPESWERTATAVPEEHHGLEAHRNAMVDPTTFQRWQSCPRGSPPVRAHAPQYQYAAITH